MRNLFGDKIDVGCKQTIEKELECLDIQHQEPSNNFYCESNNPNTLTPVQFINNIWIKRDDAFIYAGGRGGKVRSALALCKKAKIGVITAGSRRSPQVNIVAQIAQDMKIKCRVHVPSGELTPELIDAKATGCEVFQHKYGYNNVIIRRAKDDAKATGYNYIPFGMECVEAPIQTARQVANVPKQCKRIVVPCGSAMSMAGILWGLKIIGRTDVKVVGIVMGASPLKRLNKYAPDGWENNSILINAGVDYHKEINNVCIGNITLDPIYEAKCKPFIESGDLFWIVGKRKTSK